jgi:hypothetical protein
MASAIRCVAASAAARGTARLSEGRLGNQAAFCCRGCCVAVSASEDISSSSSIVCQTDDIICSTSCKLLCSHSAIASEKILQYNSSHYGSARRIQMKTFDIRFMFATATLALLTACGGGASDPAADQASPAATMAQTTVQMNAPVADCEAEGCNRPRVVDGLAEQFRASAIAAPAAELAQAGEPGPAIAPIEAGFGAGVTLQ